MRAANIAAPRITNTVNARIACAVRTPASAGVKSIHAARDPLKRIIFR
jgi:hypothetical protein